MNQRRHNMFFCEKCGESWSNLQHSKNCCSDGFFSIKKDITKKQFIERFIQLQNSLKENSLINEYFENTITPKELSEYVYDYLIKNDRIITEEKFGEYLTELKISIAINGLMDKGLMEYSGVDEKGQMLYGLTPMGKSIAKNLNK